jgi:hypothetical protein
MKILLEEVLQRMEDIRPTGETTYAGESFTYGFYELPVTVTHA